MPRSERLSATSRTRPGSLVTAHLGTALLGCITLLGTSAFADGPDCAGFGGKIHGTSKCVRVNLTTFALEPLSKRVMPGPTTKTLECGASIELSAGTATLECVPFRLTPGVTTNTTAVMLRFTLERKASRRIELDAHRGFHDFVHVWLVERDGALDMTIDHGVYD